jgi:hypothetical protein
MSSAPSSSGGAIGRSGRRKARKRTDLTQEHNVFLRWVRLKQAAKERPDTESAPTDNHETATPLVVDTAEQRPFDLSSLPAIESIVANTDIAAFLRTGVPAELTRAALRRAWTSDPAIRDFIGIAENQWDFNDPNAIPGFGPLDPIENASDFLTQVARGLEQFPDAVGDLTPPVETIAPGAALSAEPSLDQPSAIGEPWLADGCAQPSERQETATPCEKEPTDELRHGPRSHGSALPR